jgi:hypothetical protein
MLDHLANIEEWLLVLMWIQLAVTTAILVKLHLSVARRASRRDAGLQ